MKDSKDVIADFNEYVNMTASELEAWLKSDDSNSAGWPKNDGEENGESVGHDSGRKIVEILKENPDKESEKYTEDQIEHMRKVAAYCKRHLAQESGGNKDKSDADLKKTKSYASLKNWGHDAIKARKGESGKSNGTSKAGAKKGGKKAPAKKEEEDEEMKDAEEEEKPEGDKEDEAADEKAEDVEEKEEEKENDKDDEEETKDEKKTEAKKSAPKPKAGDKRKKGDDAQKGSKKKQETPATTRTTRSSAKEAPKAEKKEEPAEEEDEDDAEEEEEEKEEKEDKQEDKKSNGKKSSGKGPKKGDEVSWSWGSGNPKGKVLDVKEGDAEITTKRGNKVTRKGNPDDPAVVLDTGKSKAIKSAHELN